MHLHSHCVRIKACIDLQLQVLCKDCQRPNRFQSGDVVRFSRFSFEQTLLQVLEDKEKAIILEELPGVFARWSWDISARRETEPANSAICALVSFGPGFPSHGGRAAKL